MLTGVGCHSTRSLAKLPQGRAVLAAVEGCALADTWMSAEAAAADRGDERDWPGVVQHVVECDSAGYCRRSMTQWTGAFDKIEGERHVGRWTAGCGRRVEGRGGWRKTSDELVKARREDKSGWRTAGR